MKKEKDNIFYKLFQQKRELKREKKMRQAECVHKKSDTTCLLKFIKGDEAKKNPFVVKCRRCGEKVDLSLYDAQDGTPMEQIRRNRRKARSIFNAAKLRSNPKKDKEMLNALIKYFKATDAFYTMAKEIFADTEKGDRRNKKQQSSHFNVSRGGRTLF